MAYLVIIGILGLVTVILIDISATQRDILRWMQRHDHNERMKDFNEDL